MSKLNKSAQLSIVTDQPVLSQFQAHNADDGEKVIFVVDEESDHDPADDIAFILPEVPGAVDAEPIIIDSDDLDGDLEVTEPEDVEVAEIDPWNWLESHGVERFLEWLAEKMNNVPRHTGGVSGCERVAAYFQALLKELSKAMRLDFKGVIKAAKAEEARDEILKGIERLLERIEKLNGKQKKKKKADVENGLTKEAAATMVKGISITVPLFISAICRTLINGTISAGHDPSDMFKKLDAKYKFNPREKMEIVQLMSDMAYPLRIDRGLIDDEVDQASSQNFDWSAQRYS